MNYLGDKAKDFRVRLFYHWQDFKTVSGKQQQNVH